MTPPVAIMALDGMQSHRLAAPPTTSRSMRVTSAPRRAPQVAACTPAGPPQMIANRTATPRGYPDAFWAGSRCLRHRDPAQTSLYMAWCLEALLVGQTVRLTAEGLGAAPVLRLIRAVQREHIVDVVDDAV